MKNICIGLIICSIGLFATNEYKGSTLAPVVICGSIIRTSNLEIIKKYPRKNCPVCKGKGWYISGDNIKKVDCGYCEPEPQSILIYR